MRNVIVDLYVESVFYLLFLFLNEYCIFVKIKLYISIIYICLYKFDIFCCFNF